jgi:hemoglobin
MADPAMNTDPDADAEAAIERIVHLFYERGLADPVLGPIFRGAIHDFDAHMRIVCDFWSGVVLGTRRYGGNAFGPHARLRFEPEAFEHWLAAFESAARDALAPAQAQRAVGVARHMAQAFKAGLFPFMDAQGRPSRTPSG